MKVGALDQRIHELEEQLDGNALGLGAEGPRCEIGDEAADFTIRCKDMEWKVHQAVLSKCDFFKACFRNEFKVCLIPPWRSAIKNRCRISAGVYGDITSTA